jgi:hypothetical protein
LPVAVAEVLLVAPDGAPLPGAEVELLVVLHREGKAVIESPPTLSAERGAVVSLGAVSPGVYRYRYRTPGQGEPDVAFTIGTGSGGLVRTTLRLAPRPDSGFTLGPGRLAMRAGRTDTISFELKGEALPHPSDVVTAVSEGRVEGVYEMKDGLLVEFRPSAARFPRTVIVGVRNDRRPGAPPLWVPIRLVAHPKIPVTTEPGAVVRMQIRGRDYGPYFADDSGKAMATPDVYPGEYSASVSIEDASGNRQQTTLSLGGEAQPIVVGLAERYGQTPGAPPVVHLAVFNASGTPWTGSPPVCRISSGGTVGVHGTTPGRFELRPVAPEEEEFLDLGLGCELAGGEAKWQTRVPVGRGFPQRLRLRVYPEFLSADFPVAQVRALLEDRTGERLSPVGVVLSASVGEVAPSPVDALALAGEYNGAAAAAAGEDEIYARFVLPSGGGPTARLVVGVCDLEPDRDLVTVCARALGRDGLPVGNTAMTMSLGERSVSLTTNERGWATADFELDGASGLVWISARSADCARKLPYFPGQAGPLLQADRPDLSARQTVRITTGRIREVFISADPSVLAATPGATSRLRIKLVDRGGQLVRDDSLKVTVTAGVIESLKAAADGSITALFRPPASMQSDSVKVSATAQEGAIAASTEIVIVPRPYRRAIGVGLGGMTNFTGIGSPTLQVDFDVHPKTFPEPLLLRASLSAYGDDQTIEDVATGETVVVTSRFVPMVLGAVLRQEERARAVWIGTGLAGLFYQMTARFGDDSSTRGMGFSIPGVVMMAGVGTRVGSGEFGMEGRYLFASTPPGDLSFVGGVGGLSIVASYRVVF